MNEKDNNLKKWFGTLLSVGMIVITIVLLGTGFWLYDKNFKQLIAAIFPEIVGIMFPFLLLIAFLYYNKKGKLIYTYFESLIPSEEKPNTSVNGVNIQIDRLQEISDKLKSTILKNNSNEKLQNYSDHWHNWREELIKENHDYSEALSSAWKELIEAHLDLENEYLKSRKIKNTSESFTILIANLSRILYKEYIGNESTTKLVRYHITGMLPEEFFNGPQLEYTQFDSSPILFFHAFENQKYQASHYNFVKDKKDLPNLQVKRCITVREPSRHLDNVFNALSTLSELKEQKKLSILQSLQPRKMPALTDSNNPISNGEINRLLSKCTHYVSKFITTNIKNKNYIFIKNIVNHEDYQYYSILNSEIVKDNKNYVDLFKYFSTFFSRNEQDVYYFGINENNDDKVKKYFKNGYIPEIVLFALNSTQDLNPSQNKWLIGLHGQYKPFTREMEIEILKPNRAKHMAENLIEFMFKKNLNTI